MLANRKHKVSPGRRAAQTFPPFVLSVLFLLKFRMRNNGYPKIALRAPALFSRISFLEKIKPDSQRECSTASLGFNFDT